MPNWDFISAEEYNSIYSNLDHFIELPFSEYSDFVDYVEDHASDFISDLWNKYYILNWTEQDIFEFDLFGIEPGVPFVVNNPVPVQVIFRTVHERNRHRLILHSWNRGKPRNQRKYKRG